MKRFKHSILPAFLLSSSVGQIYAFTNFSTEIAECIGVSQKAVQFAFSLGIFFLGMGAAFFGKVVEKNIRLSTYIGTALFIGGLLTTIAGIEFASLPVIYLGYGLMLGLGTGIIYITPVKTMMLWFPQHKAIAAAVPIISFGLGSTLSTVLYKGFGQVKGFYDIFEVAKEGSGIIKVFYAFAAIYLCLMLCASALLRKPHGSEDNTQSGGALLGAKSNSFSYGKLLRDEFFIRSWLFMLLNISAGLGLIPLAKQMMSSRDIGYEAGSITLIVGLSGLFNGGGRFIFAWWSDRLKERRNILIIISLISICTMFGSLGCLWFIGFALLIINACYGAGFSVIPGVIADHYGMTNISKIHGAVLSAWGIAGLVGNQLALAVRDIFGSTRAVLWLLIAIYAINAFNTLRLKKVSAD